MDRVEGEKTLTDRGWPRPYQREVLGDRLHPARGRGYPVPWVSPAERLEKLDHERHMATIWGLLCQICGHGHEPDDVVYAFVVGDPEEVPEDLTDRMAKAQSDAMMHERCARLALSMCPALLREQQAGRVQVMATQARYVEVRYVHSDGVAREEPEEGVEKSGPREVNGADPALCVDGAHVESLTLTKFMRRAR